MSGDNIPTLSYVGRPRPTGGIVVDLAQLVPSKMLIQAASGGGKSWAIRQLCEELFGKIPILVLDIEGEFFTLREKFDFVLCAKRGGDLEASTDTAAVLARRLVELKASAVIDLYEMKEQERRHFVRLFLESVMALPRDLWTPYIIVVDEIHKLAPEKGYGESEALPAIEDLSSRGRKRGFCLVGATQSLAKFSKDVAGNLHNKLIGLTTLDVHVDRAMKELGFGRDRRDDLRQLEGGEFYAYGPAISRDVVLVKTGDVKTTHPKPGVTVSAAAVPTSAKVKALVASQLADIRREAEEEAKTLEQKDARIRELEDRVDELEVGRPIQENIDLAAIRAEYQSAFEREIAVQLAAERDAWIARFRDASRQLGIKLSSWGKSLADSATESLAGIARDHDSYLESYVRDGEASPARPRSLEIETSHIGSSQSMVARFSRELPSTRRSRSNGVPAAAKHGGGEKQIMTLIAQNRRDGTSDSEIVTAFSYKANSRRTYLGKLKTAGYIEERGDLYYPTAAGLEWIGPVPAKPRGRQLVEMWLEKLGGGELAIFDAIAHAPAGISREKLARDFQGYTPNSLRTYIGKLASRRIVVVERDTYKLAPTLR